MRYLVKIDRRSIKKNPRGGQKWSSYIPGNKCIEPDGSMSRHVTYVESLCPEPDVFYKYKDTEVSCKYCLGKFNHRDLIEEYDDDGYEVVSCPRCGKWYPCELDFENIRNITERDFG